MDALLLLFGWTGVLILGAALLVVLVIVAQRGVVVMRVRALPRGNARERVKDLDVKRAHAEATAADVLARHGRREWIG